jgi:hypothetical protein
MRLSLLFVLALLACPGCYFLPPARAGVGAGVTAGDVVTYDRDDVAERHDSAVVSEVSIGITPLAMPQDERRFDVGVGWTGTWTHAGSSGAWLDQGAFAEVAWLASGARYPRVGWRLAPTVRVEALRPRPYQSSIIGEGNRTGIGASAGLLYELVQHRRGGGLTPGAYGGHQGEIAVGVALRAGARNFDGDGTAGFVTLSLEVRWPAIAGIAVWPKSNQHPVPPFR